MSTAWSPMTIAGRGEGFDSVDIIPNGMLASEKWESGETESQDMTTELRNYREMMSGKFTKGVLEFVHITAITVI